MTVTSIDWSYLSIGLLTTQHSRLISLLARPAMVNESSGYYTFHNWQLHDKVDSFRDIHILYAYMDLHEHTLTLSY